MTPTSKTKLVEALTRKGLFRGYHPRRLRAETLFNVESPDLGWQAAKFIADNWVANSFVWSEILGSPGLENVREGMVLRVIRDYGGAPRDHRIGARAERIASDLRSSALVEALLFAVDASARGVAELIGAEPGVVAAFGDLFFDVEGRRDDMLFRQKIVEVKTALARTCLLPPSNEAKLRTHLITVACHGTMQDVVQQFRLWQGGGSEEEYIETIRKEGIFSAFSVKFGGHAEAPALAKVGLAIATKGTDPSLQGTPGTLHDPFLEQLLEDSDAYNEIFREKKNAAAEKAENSSPNQTDGSVQS